MAYSKARVTLVRSTKTDEFSEKVQRASDPHPLFSENRFVIFQFHAQKALFKGPKSAIQFFWIENDPPPSPPWNFSSVLEAPPAP